MVENRHHLTKPVAIETWLEGNLPGYRFGLVLVLLLVTFVFLASALEGSWVPLVATVLQGLTLLAAFRAYLRREAGDVADDIDAFIAARDFLLAHHDDYTTAHDGFAWPQLRHFNWARDWFDGVLAVRHGNDPALWIVELFMTMS